MLAIQIEKLIRQSYEIKSCWSVYYKTRILDIVGIFFIIKYVDLELIVYIINLDVVSSYKVFSTFDSMFLSTYIANLIQ